MWEEIKHEVKEFLSGLAFVALVAFAAVGVLVFGFVIASILLGFAS